MTKKSVYFGLYHWGLLGESHQHFLCNLSQHTQFWGYQILHFNFAILWLLAKMQLFLQYNNVSQKDCTCPLCYSMVSVKVLRWRKIGLEFSPVHGQLLLYDKASYLQCS